MRQRLYPHVGLLAASLAQSLNAAQRLMHDTDAEIKRAEDAGCTVTRTGDEVVISVPPGVNFDLRTLRVVRP